MVNLYEKRGIPTIVNAAGTLTRLSGGVMRPETIAAMADAATRSVEMDVLQAHASSVIAGITGAEAGYVASGAAACLLVGTAACITGLDAAKMARLPDTRGLRNEVIVARSQRNSYDHAVRAAGATLVEVGLPDRTSGAGVRDTEPSDYAAAIGEATAAVFWVAGPDARPGLREVGAVAHAAGVPSSSMPRRSCRRSGTSDSSRTMAPISSPSPVARPSAGRRHQASCAAAAT